MPTPHDALVRQTFGQLEHARGLLRSIVPEKLSALVDWHTLELLDGSFVDEQLAERQTDLLYKVRLAKREALIYVLLEHQSSTDHWMALRLLVYFTRIWERCRVDAPDSKLPAIIPIVLHHSARGWTAPTRLGELVDADHALRTTLGPLLPDFQFHLVDLTREDDRALRAWLATDLGKLVALCLKHAPYDRELEARLSEWLDLLGKIARAPGGLAALDVVARYILEVTDLAVDRLRRVLQSGLSTQQVEAVMTGAEKLREEGRALGRAEGKAEGKAEGEVKGRAEVVLKLLTLRFGPLSPATESTVRSATVEQLDRWTERILSAATLQDVLGA